MLIEVGPNPGGDHRRRMCRFHSSGNLAHRGRAAGDQRVDLVHLDDASRPFRVRFPGRKHSRLLRQREAYRRVAPDTLAAFDSLSETPPGLPPAFRRGYWPRRRMNAVTSSEASWISVLSKPGFKLSCLGIVRGPCSAFASSLRRTWLPLLRTTFYPTFWKIAMASAPETSRGSLWLIERWRQWSSVFGSNRGRFRREPPSLRCRARSLPECSRAFRR